MPKNIQDSFTEEQLANITIALGARTWGNHAIDVRTTMILFRYRYYYMLIAGRDRRELSAREKRIGLLMQTSIVAMFLAFSAIPSVLVSYLVMSTVGIDIFCTFFF